MQTHMKFSGSTHTLLLSPFYIFTQYRFVFKLLIQILLLFTMIRVKSSYTEVALVNPICVATQIDINALTRVSWHTSISILQSAYDMFIIIAFISA